MPTSKRLLAPLIVMFAVIVSMVAFSGPANAAYGDPPRTSVSDQTPVAGASVEFCGSGFLPGETVTITLGDTGFPSAVADSNGDFCTTLVLGASLSGTYTLTATGTTSGTTSSTEIVVAGASANAATTSGGTTGGLAFTGAAVAGIGVLGGLLLVGGAAMVVAGRRRKINA